MVLIIKLIFIILLSNEIFSHTIFLKNRKIINKNIKTISEKEVFYEENKKIKFFKSEEVLMILEEEEISDLDKKKILEYINVQKQELKVIKLDSILNEIKQEGKIINKIEVTKRSIFLPGYGHYYAGQKVKGVSYFLIFLGSFINLFNSKLEVKEARSNERKKDFFMESLLAINLYNRDQSVFFLSSYSLLNRIEAEKMTEEKINQEFYSFQFFRLVYYTQLIDAYFTGKSFEKELVSSSFNQFNFSYSKEKNFESNGGRIDFSYFFFFNF